MTPGCRPAPAASGLVGLCVLLCTSLGAEGRPHIRHHGDGVSVEVPGVGNVSVPIPPKLNNNPISEIIHNNPLEGIMPKDPASLLLPDWGAAKYVRITDKWSVQVLGGQIYQYLFFSRANLRRFARASDGLTWMAADAATSVHISKNRHVWLFGDTYLGRNLTDSSWTRTKAVSGMTRQSIAVVNFPENLPPPPSQIDFNWKSIEPRKTPKGSSPDEVNHGFFVPTPLIVNYDTDDNNKTDEAAALKSNDEDGSEGAGSFWYWVVAGVRLEDAPNKPLFLTAAINLKAKNPWGFADGGSSAILVSNPDDSPTADHDDNNKTAEAGTGEGGWRYTQVRIPTSGPNLRWHAALARDPPYVYFVGAEGTAPASKQVLARVPEQDLATLNFTNMEVWAQTQQDPGSGSGWSSPAWLLASKFVEKRDKGNTAQLVDLFDGVRGNGAAPELSLVYNRMVDLWVSATLGNYDFKVLLWTSKEVTGPWTSTEILDVAAYDRYVRKARKEEDPAVPVRVRNYYSVKIHPELSFDYQMVFTYCANWNNGTFAPPQDYTPRFFRLYFFPNP